MGLTIDIAVEHDGWLAVVDRDALVRRAVEASLATAKVALAAEAELSIVLCDDAFIRDLNRRWRGKDEPTNVLSFPQYDAPHGDAPEGDTPESDAPEGEAPQDEVTVSPAAQTMLGDVVVAFETSAAEAAEQGRALADYLSVLVVHGVFHLIGYDHVSDEEAEIMETLETETLQRLAIRSPYLQAEDVHGPS